MIMNTQYKYKASLVKRALEPYKKSDHWQKYSDHWKVALNNEHFDFYTGVGLRKYGTPTPPQRDDVLHSILMDYDAVDMEFDEWCDTFGYNNDSIKNLKIYKACIQNGRKLRRTGIDIKAERTRLANY